ncbi:MAG TPA: hypothetical protein PLE99_10955 [Candidatus Thiothrix moscowensis]|uniref:hypothetical protein n=1 Tax=unclassified Thiothrix TaxID=2636184 RepID=UPI0026011B75|nr:MULTISPECIES: hypothetical protein [unclassified Thiothrix]HRJ53279.1 hypothetical protein [Candidatus Thiothrix moscowensis]HRJ93151.1 hypothetical protein [Candidatus Thiothrix moscowensis]
MEKLTENILIESVKQGLDYSADNLDMHTRVRLTRIRLQAIEQNNRSSSFFHVPSFAHGFAAAAVVTLFVALWVLPNADQMLSPQSVPPVSTLVMPETEASASASVLDGNEMDILMSHEEMDFLENLEIYEWLEAEYG